MSGLRIRTFRGRARGPRGTQTEAFGIKFPSKAQAEVYGQLRAEQLAEGFTIFREPRFPLPNLDPDANGKPLCFTPDFLLRYEDGTFRVVDAKCGTARNREWLRGKAAFEAFYGLAVEEREPRPSRPGRRR